jgi:valyl-tRNA synthetase
MMMMGLQVMGDVPFATVYIHALVRDEKGQKMSKSKGNVIDPLALIDRYGADALRFTLAALAVQGRDVKLSEARVEGYRNFATKLWNAARFCEMNGARPVKGFDPRQATETVNRWLVGKLADAAARATEALAAYRFNDYAGVLYHFTWGSFCDWYLEFVKPILLSGTAAAQAETRAVAGWALDQVLALLHPVMPFITEELYQQAADRGGRLLVAGGWPAFDASFQDVAAEAEMDWVVRLVSLVRGIRAEMNVPAAARIPLILKDADAGAAARLGRHRELILSLARLASAETGTTLPAGAVQAVLDGTTVLLPIREVIDVGAERARLAREIGRLDGEIRRLDGKLANAGFLAKAPPEVVETEREKRADAVLARDRLADAVRRLEAL